MYFDVCYRVSSVHPTVFVFKAVISLLLLITLVVVVLLLILTLLFTIRGTDGDGDRRVRGTELKVPRSFPKAGGRPEVSCFSPTVVRTFCMARNVLRRVSARSYSETGWEW
jgi:hypothetical protein